MSAATLTDLWHETVEDVIFGTKDEITTVGQHSMLFDRTLKADSMEYKFDVSRELWMTVSRFTVLQNDYIDPKALHEFKLAVRRLPEKRATVAQMLARPKGKRHVSFNWGNCILAWTYRRLPEPVFIMHSRITNITRMGGLDLALAYCIADEVGVDLKHTQFVWKVDCIVHGGMLAMPYVYSHGLDKQLEGWDETQYPCVRRQKREIAYFDRLDAEGRVGKHGTRMRIRQQRRAFIDGKLIRPKVPLDRLDLLPIKEQW